VQLPVPEIRAEERKLAELVLYISQKCANDPCFGATKLNKILYFSDFLAYGNWGASITGSEYQNLPNGPAPRRLLPVREALVAHKELVVQAVQLMSGNVQHRTVNLREPDLTVFSGAEIALVDDVIRRLEGMDAERTSELSHRMVGWKMTQPGETISYQTVFLSDEPITKAEAKRGLELARALKLIPA